MQILRSLGFRVYPLPAPRRSSSLQSLKRIPNLSKDCQSRIRLSSRFPRSGEGLGVEVAGVGSGQEVEYSAGKTSPFLRRPGLGSCTMETKTASITAVETRHRGFLRDHPRPHHRPRKGSLSTLREWNRRRHHRFRPRSPSPDLRKRKPRLGRIK